MDDEIIQVQNLIKKFKKNLVLDNINLSIPEGKITAIIGASGEGKTTILKLLVGFYKPTSGEVKYLRKNIFKEIKDIKKVYGFATEDGSFYEKLSVKENLFHFSRLYGLKHKEIKEKIEELVNLVDLKNATNTLAENLSIGMKKRLDIACSLVQDPAILILDEPTADLDILLRKSILKLIKDINKKGKTIILTTQLLNEVDEICDKIVILNNKKIVDQGSPTEIKQKYNKKSIEEVFTKIFSTTQNLEKENYQMKNLVNRIKNLAYKEKKVLLNKIHRTKNKEPILTSKFNEQEINSILTEHLNENNDLHPGVKDIINDHFQDQENQRKQIEESK